MSNKQPLSKLNLEAFLNHKTLYYDKIDFSIVQNAWKSIEPSIQLPFVIHVVGTNGKGTTGRFLAAYLHKLGKDVLHYTSPHIQHFNERIWINGANASDATLEEAHRHLCTLLDQEALEKLTYFEYTTLLALFLSSKRDFIVLEAGLGGEFDATNVVKNDLSLITTIGLDHTQFLGNSIELIAKTKMRSVDTCMIVGHQVYDEVYTHAQAVKEAKKEPIEVIKANMQVNLSSLQTKLPTYLQYNLKLAIAALEKMKIKLDLKLFEDIKFQGRCEKITKNITVDVGHNPLAAKELVKEFLPHNKKITLIYNAFEDKDYKKVLEILKPIIKNVEILQLKDKRVVKEQILNEVCDNLNIISTPFKKLDINQAYLVFGSFLVVEKFLEIYKEFNEK